MRRSPLKNNRKFAFAWMAAALLFCCVMSAVPAQAAATLSDAKDGPRLKEGAPAQETMRWQDGKVTDGDGWIGNSSWGADRAPDGRGVFPHGRDHGRQAHRPHASAMRAEVAGATALLSDANGRGGEGNMSRAAGEGQRVADDIRDGIERAADPLLPDASDSDLTKDGSVDDGHASDGDVTDGQGHAPSAQDGGGQDATADEASSSVLPWVITILVALAVVLVILAFVPKKNRSHR